MSISKNQCNMIQKNFFGTKTATTLEMSLLPGICSLPV